MVATGLKNVSGLAQDSQGRLWAVTAAFNDIGTDALYVIPAPGQDAVKVAGDLHTPMGLLWTSDRLYVSSAEGVIAFDGFDGARFAKQQTIATFSGAGIMGGLALGNDGRIRVGISAACDNCVPDSKWAASVVSFLPDGSEARVEASGIRAPVGLAYVPGTNDLLVTMNQRDDLGDATPGDYLALVLSGQTWGFPSCYGQGGSDCAGVPPPIAEMDKHAAVSGIAVLTVAGKTSAFAAEWATGKLVRVELISSNGSYSGTIEQPITGIQGPVGVTASGGSSLLVGDWVTGTVYKITLPAT
ncbi:MAG: hypothetical protein ABI577_05305 [bacterium]